jgi:DNA processing protein
MIKELNAYVALSIIQMPSAVKVGLLKKLNYKAELLFYDWNNTLNEFLKWKNKFSSFSDWSLVEKIIEESYVSKASIVTAASSFYPNILKQTPDHPVLMFCKGDIELLQKKSLSVVGTRRISAYGKIVVSRLVPELCRAGFCIVSGMATGVDSESHIRALESKGSTIAVLGSGINTPFPTSNKRLYESIINEGLVISEFAPNTPGFKANFPMRNRIIAGLSDGTLIVEAGMQSGSLITASIAVTYSRDVFCVPGPINSVLSEGTNSLIKKGAVPVCSSDDIFAHYNMLFNTKILKIKREQISDGARKMLGMLDTQGSSASDLLCSSGLGPAQLFKNLEELELSGYIFRDAFGIYHLN